MRKGTKPVRALFSLTIFLIFITFAADGATDDFGQAKQHLYDGIRTYDGKLLLAVKESFINMSNNNPSEFIYPYYVSLTYLSLCDLKNFEISKSSIRMKKNSLKKERIALAEGGLIYADKSIKLKDNFSESHRVKCALISNRISGMVSGMLNGHLAEDEINLALQIEPDSALAQIETARKFLNKPSIVGGDVKKGIEILEEVVKNNPNLERGYLNLGIAYEKNGDKEKAMNTFRHLLDLNQEDLEAKFYLERLMRLKHGV